MERLSEYIFIACMGAIFGSFLNVVIYRLPRKESLSFPPSHCTACGTPIHWYDNIPIIAYFLLQGKCRSCGTRISAVYPIVELSAAVCAVILYMTHGRTVLFARDFSFALILIAATVIDLRYMIIPNSLNAAGAILGIVFAAWGGLTAIQRSLIGAVIGFCCIMGMYMLGKLLYKRDGVGFGDVKLAAVMGIFLGPFWIVISFLGAVFVGGIWGVIVLFIKKKRIGQEVPFGPFLALGGFFALFFQQEILYLIDYYISLW